MGLTKVSTDGYKDQSVDLTKLPHGDGSSDGKFLRANNGADPSFESIPAGTTINNNADNRVITGDSNANTLNAESSVVIDANGKLGVGTASPEDLLHIKSGKLRIENAIVSNNDSTISYDNSNFLIDVDPNNVRGSSKFEIKVDTVTGLVIDDNRNVGIGENAPADNKLRVTSGLNNCIVAKSSNGNGGYENFTGLTSANAKTFYVTHNGRVGAADGIIFGSDTAAANALDDYEEGTFTPSVTFDVGGSGITYGTRSGTYTKIGRLVTIAYFITISGGVSDGNTNYFCRMVLPFAGIAGTGQETRVKQWNSGNSQWWLSSGGTNPVFFKADGAQQYARGNHVNGYIISGVYTYMTT